MKVAEKELARKLRLEGKSINEIKSLVGASKKTKCLL
jgi:hypothetical protein